MPTGVVMLVKCKQKLDEELKELRAGFMNDMGLTEEDFYNVSRGGALIKATNEDYEIIPVDENEFFWLNVNFWRAYYGIGYERGDVNLYVKSAEWLEQNIPNCEVYYGHDGNDENISLFDKKAREELLERYRKSVRQDS